MIILEDNNMNKNKRSILKLSSLIILVVLILVGCANGPLASLGANLDDCLIDDGYYATTILASSDEHDEAKPLVGSEAPLFYTDVDELLMAIGLAKFSEFAVMGVAPHNLDIVEPRSFPALSGVKDLFMPRNVRSGFDMSGINVHGANVIAFLHDDVVGNPANFIWSRTITAANATTDFFGRGAIAEYIISRNGINYYISEWVTWDTREPDGWVVAWAQSEQAFMASLPANFTKEDVLAFCDAQALVSWELDGDAVSVSIQGMSNVRIFENNSGMRGFSDAGNEIIVIGNHLYRSGLGRINERVGYRWLIDSSTRRYQYVLKPGNYEFRADDVAGQPELLIQHFAEGSRVSVVDYSQKLAEQSAVGFHLTVTHDPEENDLTINISGGGNQVASSIISAGSNHAAVVRYDGTIWAWGSNSSGRLGNGMTIDRHVPVQVQTLTNMVAVSAGGSHTVALREDGTAWSWGNNWQGQLGDGTTVARSTPVQVRNLTNIIAIEAVGSHTIALNGDGTVWAWGQNNMGQLGDGTTVARNTPVQVQNLENIVAVSAGGTHTLAVRNDGTVWSWGRNLRGELGDGTTINRHAPVQVQNLENIVAVSAGGTHTLAIRNDGTVWAWGTNMSGQLGDSTTVNRSTPVQVQNLTNVVAVSAGSNTSFALKDDGTVWAWGDNWHGGLGDGTTLRRLLPVQVQNLVNVIDIEAGGMYTLALRDDGTVWSWGNNHSGQLGNATREVTQTAPVQVWGLNGEGFLNLKVTAPTYEHPVPKAVVINSQYWCGSFRGGPTTRQLTAAVYPLTATQNMIWSTSNDNIVTVDQTGLVRVRIPTACCCDGGFFGFFDVIISATSVNEITGNFTTTVFPATPINFGAFDADNFMCESDDSRVDDELEFCCIVCFPEFEMLYLIYGSDFITWVQINHIVIGNSNAFDAIILPTEKLRAIDGLVEDCEHEPCCIICLSEY